MLMRRAPSKTGMKIRNRHLMPGVYQFYEEPLEIGRGQMQYLFDRGGRRYLDGLSGMGVCSAGHCNPEIGEAICTWTGRLQHTTTLYLTEPMLRLASKLAACGDEHLPRVFFCNSGSEANDGALLMARRATGRRRVLALRHGLHGRTESTARVSELPMWNEASGPHEDVEFVPSFIEEDSLDTIQKAMRSEDGAPAAIIVEPIQGNGGIRTPPEGWFAELRRLCDAWGAMLIADEVQTGINRTGHFFALDRWGVRPDIRTLAKALGNGQPIAAIQTSEEVAALQTRPTASTFGSNPVSCAAALATLEYHERHGLAGRAGELGGLLRDGLTAVCERHEGTGEVRGQGLMLGLELPDRGDVSGPQRADRVLELMKRDGCLIGKSGRYRNVLTFMPPMVIDPKDVAQLVGSLDQALAASHGF